MSGGNGSQGGVVRAARRKPTDRTERSRSRGSYKKSEASRKQVLDAAIRALAENGYARTSVNDIAVAAGMSKGAVHYHFESKDDLIAQVLEECAATMHEHAREAWNTSGEPRDKVRAAVRAMWAMRRDGRPELRVLADLMAQALHDPKLKKPIAGMFRAMRSEVTDYLTTAIDQFGLQPKIPPHIIPRLIVSTLDGMALHEFFDPPAEADEEQVLAALETIAASLFDF